MSEHDLYPVQVHGFCPLFRYVVASATQSLSEVTHHGIPFYRLASARRFFEATREHLPWAGVLLLRRNWGRLLPLQFYPARLHESVNPLTFELTQRLVRGLNRFPGEVDWWVSPTDDKGALVHINFLNGISQGWDIYPSGEIAVEVVHPGGKKSMDVQPHALEAALWRFSELAPL